MDGDDLRADHPIAGAEAGAEPVGDRFVKGIVGRRAGRDRPLTARVVGVPLDLIRLDALAIQDVLDGLTRVLDHPEQPSGLDRPGRVGDLGDLAEVVVEADQVDQDRPDRREQKVLLIFLKLGMKPGDDFLSRRLGADLTLEALMQAVEPIGERPGQPSSIRPVRIATGSPEVVAKVGSVEPPRFVGSTRVESVWIWIASNSDRRSAGSVDSGSIWAGSGRESSALMVRGPCPSGWGGPADIVSGLGSSRHRRGRNRSDRPDVATWIAE